MSPHEEEPRFVLVRVVDDKPVRGVPVLRLHGKAREIGRSFNADYLVTAPAVSRSHAAVWTEDGVPFIKDLDSSNGTFVNSKSIGEPTALSVGDVVTIGQHVAFVLQIEEADWALPDVPTAPELELLTGAKEEETKVFSSSASNAARSGESSGDDDSGS